MAELNSELSERQCRKFLRVYNKLKNTVFSLQESDRDGKKWWDFKCLDSKTEEVLFVQYTEAKINANIHKNEAEHKKDVSIARFAYRFDALAEIVGAAYQNKLLGSDKNTILLIGFHHVAYDPNDKIPGFQISELRESFAGKYGNHFKWKELWIVNLNDGACDLIFPAK